MGYNYDIPMEKFAEVKFKMGISTMIECFSNLSCVQNLVTSRYENTTLSLTVGEQV